ncbi:Condensin complex subunit 2 [Mycena sanguinolenta]|uniref:Condensin complex subunit 2 n=1 Tax=Mycena sanguinolenta TaxID=230812 RepID=A0A8H7DKL1_9AGAR|nr:Condensin complex subunit 2 [Mycena sanguinolenta]
MSSKGLQGSLARYPGFVNPTCAIQRNITEEALLYFSHADLENRWMVAGADERGKHILDAMAGLCSKARNLNEARSYCPELSLKRLRTDGKIFLDLLKAVMLEDASFIPTTGFCINVRSRDFSVPCLSIFVSHPGWDAWAAEQEKLNDSELKKVSCAEILILRTKLISYVVQFTLRSFVGLPPPEFSVQKEYKSNQKTKSPALHPALAELLGGPEAAKARFKDEKAAMKARHSQRVAHCSYLSCTETEPADGSLKFPRCKTCFEKMQRQVLYCSATCQKADWKLRHKAVCGKSLDFETVSRPVENPATASTADTRIGPPVNGYKRSLALIAQVTALNRNPTFDYILYDANNQPKPIDFGAGQYPQLAFRECRELAMTTGDPSSVAIMAHYLCILLSTKNCSKDFEDITPNMIVAQFAREFGIDDLRQRVLVVQHIQDLDPLHRPPLLINASPELWAVLNKDVNLDKVLFTLD